MEVRIDLFTSLPLNAKCVEVGTRFGDFAKEIITKRPDLDLTVVDSWLGKFADGEAVTRLNLTGTNVKIVKLSSYMAAINFDAESLDLVYIDAAHDYASVVADLKCWWPKVKPGGILAGHDYETKPDDGFWGPIEVKKSVDLWAGQNKLKVSSMEANAPSWWVAK